MPGFWKINDSLPADLGVEVVGWDEEASTIDELTLDLAVQDYAGVVPDDLEYGELVTLKYFADDVDPGTIMFQGRVTRTPRSMNPSSERIGYTVSGPMWDMDNLPFREQRTYYKEGEPNDEETVWTGAVTLDGKTGTRIGTIIDSAIAQGANMLKGTIDEGIDWFVTTHTDGTCGQAVRDYARLTPDASLIIDYSTATPTIHFRAHANLTEVTFDITDGDVAASHSIESHDGDIPAGVVVVYERTLTVNGSVSIEAVVDSAGATSGFGVLPITVPLDGPNITTEKAWVNTRDIPTDAAADAAAKKWWIKHSPELQAVAAIVTEDTLAGILHMPSTAVAALDIRTHKRSLPSIPTVPEPVNPNSSPVAQTSDVADYPRELIGGGIPDWVREPVRRMDVTATIAVLKSSIDAIANKDVRIAMQGIFKHCKEIDGTEYLAANFDTQINATSAENREYSHTTSFDPGETVPTGIAAAVYGQYTRLRHSGTLVTVSRDVAKDLAVGKVLSLTGGRTEWATMKEIIQAVSYDVVSGTVTATYGPPEQLGPQDMIERLRAHKRAPVRYTMDKDTEPPTLGGMTATPIDKTSRLEERETPKVPPLGPLHVCRRADGTAVITPVPTHFNEINFGAVTSHVPEIAGSSVDADPSPKFTLAAGTHTVYAEFTTTEMGVITGTVEYKTTAGAVPGSTNHVPPSAAGAGTTGDYKKPIGIYVVDADSSKAVIFKPIAAPEWVDGTRKISNVGGEVELHMETTSAGEDKFRTLKADGTEPTASTGETLHDVWVNPEEDGDNVKFSGKVVIPNPTGSTYDGTAYIHVDNTDSTVHLVNANKANYYPEQGSTGFWPFYTVLAGSLGHTQVYCAEPLDEGTALPQESDNSDQHDDGGTTS